MFSTSHPPIEHYRSIGTETAVSQASPHQLVMLLYDGALAAVLQARHAVATGDTATKLSTLKKAMRIIDEGLKASVMSAEDPAMADNLRALYDHMVSRLFIANLHSSDQPLEEVARLLGELRSAWAEIAPAVAARANLQA
jgi:flagellar protein FliS